MKHWMLEAAEYGQRELQLGRSVSGSFYEARSRKVVVTPRHRMLLRPGLAPYLLACNSHSRLLWANAWCSELSKFLDLDADHRPPEQPIYLLTVTDVRCCTADAAHEISIREFRNRLRPRARGLNYVGMIEPAYYVNLCKGALYKGRRTVSWHAHYLVWGMRSKKLKKIVAEWNRKQSYQAIAEGIPATHVVEIDGRDLAKTTCYILKSPSNGYRLRKREVVTTDGEVVFKFIQRKQLLRKGELLRLFHLTKALYLDELSLAGGQGVALLKRIKWVALHRLRNLRKFHIPRTG